MKIAIRKTIISIVLGLACFFGSRYALTFTHPPYIIAIEWCEILPFIAAMAFGARYGLVAGIIGFGALFPFTLYPNNGWGNVVTSILLVLTYFSVGYFYNIRKKKPAIWNNPILIYPIASLFYSLFFFLLFPFALKSNPPFWYPNAVLSIPPEILNGIVVKSYVILLLEMICADFLLNISAIRKFFGMEINSESRYNGRIALISFLFFGLSWFVFIFFNRIFVEQTFPHLTFPLIDSHEVIAIVLFFAISLIVGTLLSKFLEMRLRSEQELLESREDYHLIFEQISDGVFTTLINGQIIKTNQSLCELTGYSQKELLQLNIQELIFEPKMVNLSQILDELKENGVQFLEVSLRNKNGLTIYSETSARLLSNGRIQFFVRDITDRKKAEITLRANEEHYRALFENSPLGYQSLDADGKFIEVNQAWLDILGYTREEVIDHWFGDFLIPEMVDAFRERFPKFKEAGEVHNQFRMVHKEGHIIVVSFDGRIGYDLEGHFKQTHCILNDITMRQRILNDLQESEKRLRTTLLNAPFPVMLHADNGEVILISQAWTALTGYSLEEIPTIEDWIKKAYGDEKDQVKADIDRLYFIDEPTNEGEYIITAKDGGKLIWEFGSSNLGALPDGRKLLVSMAMDVTQRKKIENQNQKIQSELKHLLDEADLSRTVLLNVVEDQKLTEEKLNQLNLTLEERVAERTSQLIAANKELEAFSYSVSHDLRAPLRGIDGWSLALKEDYQDKLDEKGNLYISRVRGEIQRMGQLIDGLLLLSRVTRMETNQTTLNLSNMVESTISRIREENPDRKFVMKIEPGLHDRGDMELLQIVFTNLLENAIKFSSKASSPLIEFGSVIIDGKPTYFIKDNGAGFEMNYAKNLFGPFQRMHKQSEFPGTGVGLATVQRIISRHNGRVWAEAKVNEGATFFFTLWEEK